MGASSSAARVGRYVDLATRILALPPTCGQTRVLAVDGPGGAGKSTFAGRVAKALGDVPIVHTDDFASWDNQFSWWPRLLDQVFKPLRQRLPGRYQRYDWVRRELAEWHDVPAAPAVVIEGVGSARRQFAADLAFTVWIDTPPDLRLRRGIERDGEALRDFWLQWRDGEERHFAADATRERADLVVSGDPQLPHDPETQFVVLEGLAAAPP